MIVFCIVLVALIFLGVAIDDGPVALKCVCALMSAAFFAFAFAHHLGVAP